MSLVSRRFISSLVAKPNAITLSLLQSKLSKGDHSQDELVNLVQALIASENQSKNELINMIFDGIDSFGIYFKIPQVSKLPLESQIRLLDLNPGRVLLSKELAKEFARDHPSLSLKLLEKVIRGERYEALEFEMELQELLETLELMKGEEKFQVSTDLLEEIILKLDKLNAISMLDQMATVCEISPQALSIILDGNDLNPYTYLKLFGYLEQGELNSITNYVNAIEVLNNNEELLKSISAHEESIAKGLGIPFVLVDLASIFAIVESKEIESVAIRLQLMKYLAYRLNDFPKLLQKYHYYSTHAKSEFHLLQNQLVIIYGYHLVDTQIEINLQIMNSLLTEEITVAQLQLLIIANAVFDADNLIQVFNDYISQLSTKTSEKTNRSPSGRLTEALVVAFLSRNDREFAQLILEKLASNGKVGELEVTLIKKHLKVWGDSFAESENWIDAEPIFRKHVLQFMQTL
ncbi:uncharacterized protein KQ657_003719 [Scheffersomyces spartinae]|uniref:Uncharacterized protein n=1 Tax=Scheffersomyces spartinae TaxID=45513 RepID=A0A9P8AJT1_9ASCO|nr:uncharacterized protein KQ657_003719 [Scheffersomyces spartinae]KAG7195194.1 hypothetical protein KQ657_003719 [Scheffersomyces spartinae]